MPIAIIPWIIYQLYGNHPKPWSRRKRPPLCALQSGSWAGPEQPGSVGSVSGHQGGYQPAGPPQNIGIIDTCAAEQKVWSGMSVQPISSKKLLATLVSESKYLLSHPCCLVYHPWRISLLGHSKPWLKSFKRGVPSVDSPFFPQHWTHPAPSGPAQRVASNNEFKGRCLAKTWHQEWGSPNHHFLGQLQAKCMEDNLSLSGCL